MRDPEQAVQLERVSDRIAGAVLEFFRQNAGLEFFMADLEAFVERYAGRTAPGSGGRIMRDLRKKGQVRVELLSRSESRYRCAPRFAEDPDGQTRFA